MEAARSGATAPPPPAAEAGPRSISLRANLMFLLLVCALPALCVSAYLAEQNFRLQRRAVYSDTEILARRAGAELDRAMAAIESGLHVLATSESLRSGDLGRFHQVASDALQSQIAYNYVLIDSSGRQLLNTLRPWGTPLPESGSPPSLQQIFSRGDTVLSDFFIGPVTGKPALAMGVPVFRDARVVYSLNVGLAPERLDEVLARVALPPGWLLAILDRSGTIVARSRDSQRFVGQRAVPSLLEAMRARPSGTLDSQTKEGQEVVTAFMRSETWGWTVVIGAPKTLVEGAAMRNLPWLLLALVLFALGLWQAFRQAQRVVDTVQQLNEAALALGRGGPVQLPQVQLREAEAVGQAIMQAAQRMADVQHMAYHDALTGLANRALFQELLQFQLTAAQRSGATLAVLALDLDNFKQVNDAHGHACGDQLLRGVAARLLATLRASDVAARVGGDEFLLLLCAADEAGAAEMATRLLATLREPYEGVPVPVTASIGIAVYPQAGVDPSALVESADRALYAAKRAGRNNVQKARA